jgi:putative peptidoglycan lipid II flippase
MSDVAVTTPLITAPQTHQPRKSFLAHAKLIGILTLASRLFGLAREIVAAHYLGTGLVASAFTVAFTIPNLFRKLFGEGALSAAFIPLYSQEIRHNQPQQANDFAAASVNLLCLILLSITVVGEVLLWTSIAFADRPDLILTLKLTSIMLPYVLLICGGAFLSGILQVHDRFGAPAAAPIILNICHILVLGIGGWILGLGRMMPEAQAIGPQTKLAYAAAVVVLIAGAMQVLILLPGLRATGFHFRIIPRFWTPQVKRMLKLTVPVALGAGVLQLSVLMDKGIAIGLMQHVDPAGNAITHFSAFGHSIRLPMESGAPRRLDIAQFLYQFPLGVFAIALATAIFPSLSSKSLENDPEHFKSTLRQGLEATIFEGLPASLGLIIVSGPAIRLLFQHGQITPHDVELIQRSVIFYAAAIWAFSMLQIINRAYYAIHDTTTPVLMSILNIVLNLVVEIPLLWIMGEPAMAVGTMVSFAIQTLVMLYMLNRRVGGLQLQTLLMPTLKMMAATTLMGACLFMVMHSSVYPHGASRPTWSLQLTLLIGIGATVYLASCWLLRLDILTHLLPKRRRAANARSQ